MPGLTRQAIREKSFEIAQAFFRVGAASFFPEFRVASEKQALKIFSAASDEDYSALKSALMGGEHLLTLGLEGDYLNKVDEQIIRDEIESLYPAILEPAKDTRQPKADLSGIFKRTSSQEVSRPASDIQIAQAQNRNNLSVQNRQQAILETIRQSGKVSEFGCRMKDLLEALPDSSERTLRNDLQDLLTEGKIERIGSGGPATFYRVKNAELQAPTGIDASSILRA